MEEEQNNWFNEQNNENVDGDKNELQFDENDLFGVVKPVIDESDRFLGRIPGKKARIRIIANGKGDETMEEPVQQFQGLSKCFLSKFYLCTRTIWIIVVSNNRGNFIKLNPHFIKSNWDIWDKYE